MDQEKDCLFCNIAKKEIPSDIVYEDENVLAFKDINPQAPVHIVIIPKEHYANILEVDENSDTFKHLIKAAQKISKELNLDDGFRLVINTGEEGGQTVNHLHLHLLGGRFMEWPPG